MEITVSTTEETKKLAKQLAQHINKGDIIALYGDLGSGKTTFTRYLVESLGIDSRVQSPTFVIHREYVGNNIKVNHLDLYRLTTRDEAIDLGIEDILNSDDISIIEWPEVIEDLLKDRNVKRIYFKYIDENKRLIKFQ